MIKKLIKFFFCPELIPYTLVGALGTVIDFITFLALILSHHPPLVSQWLAGLVGFTHNHFWHHYLVFEHDQKFRKTYPASMLINFVCVAASGPILILLNQCIANIWINKLIDLVFFMIIVFIIRKRWIFVSEPEAHEKKRKRARKKFV